MRLANRMNYVQAGGQTLVAMSRDWHPDSMGEVLAERALEFDVRYADFDEYLGWLHHADVMNLSSEGEEFTETERQVYAVMAWNTASILAPGHFG